MAEKPMVRNRKAKKKVCSFCQDKVTSIDYKDVAKLRRYVSERGTSSECVIMYFLYIFSEFNGSEISTA